VSAPPAPHEAGPLGRLFGSWASFAGIFIVTNLGLLAVGATLPVLPRSPASPPTGAGGR